MANDSDNSVTIPMPANSHIYITGFTNSGWWGQQITVQLPNAQPIVWTGSGAQSNDMVGQCEAGPFTQQEQEITISMAHDEGNGWVPSTAVAFAYNMPGLSGYVIGGYDGGGRPSGPAFWNTVAFVYWAESY